MLVVTSAPAAVGHFLTEWKTGTNDLSRMKNSVPVDFVAWWHRVWPPTALAAAMIVDAAWIGLLGYGVVKLL